ncbi:type VI secretion protein ImpB [Hyphococcus flavus]|uniref:DNA-directed DNA polymerase n=1 Tax=Hyphococcus flavus TaxID=1866326 RepID=A0AAF0CGE0_9PROT|nr:type VI secretion protein ImpB [Hyphococcus flavus]WDI30552.1 type VI secretion protein ImpB [Hyphococcus flavus]
MRKPETIERLYLDFDGFFASVMQQAFPALRGHPVGVIPFETDKAKYTTVIACSKEAKAQGVQNVMRTPDAQALCPDIVLVMQRPDLFRRAHNALLNEISCEIPIDTAKSIDELTCKLGKRDIVDPQGLAARLKKRIAENVGPHITCSIGFAANRLLAKLACKMDKPNGVTIWEPEGALQYLSALPLSEISGIGGRMEKRLNNAGIYTTAQLTATQPKQMRALWGNVNGERMWYGLHGYDIQAQPTGRGMYGHGRVLPPELRKLDKARDTARLLLTKAARRMRRDFFYANKLWLWLDLREGGWFGQRDLPCVNDDQAILAALSHLWDKAAFELPRRHEIVRAGVTLLDLMPADGRQLDLFLNDDRDRQRWERITFSIDALNRKFGKRVVSVGPWKPPPGGYAGGKIAYTRIPSAEDFW